MALTKETLDTLANQLQALAQRHNAILTLAQTLSAGVLYRAPDGSLTVPIADKQRIELEDAIYALSQDVQASMALITAHLPRSLPATPGGPPGGASG